MSKAVALVVAAAVLGIGTALLLPTGGRATPDSEAARKNNDQSASLEALNQSVANQRALRIARTAPQPDEKLETRPGHEAYDPFLLSMVLDESPVDLHAAEPVSTEFAEPRAAFLRDTLQRDLAEHFPEARIADIDCRTSSCRVEIHAPESQGTAVHDYIQLPPLGNGQQPGLSTDPAGHAVVSLVILFVADHRDHALYERSYREQRAARIPGLRAAGVLVPSP